MNKVLLAAFFSFTLLTHPASRLHSPEEAGLQTDWYKRCPRILGAYAISPLAEYKDTPFNEDNIKNQAWSHAIISSQGKGQFDVVYIPAIDTASPKNLAGASEQHFHYVEGVNYHCSWDGWLYTSALAQLRERSPSMTRYKIHPDGRLLVEREYERKRKFKLLDVVVWRSTISSGNTITWQPFSQDTQATAKNLSIKPDLQTASKD